MVKVAHFPGPNPHPMGVIDGHGWVCVALRYHTQSQTTEHWLQAVSARKTRYRGSSLRPAMARHAETRRRGGAALRSMSKILCSHFRTDVICECDADVVLCVNERCNQTTPGHDDATLASKHLARSRTPTASLSDEATHKSNQHPHGRLGRARSGGCNGVAFLALAGGRVAVMRPGEGCHGGRRAASTQWLDNGCARSLIRAAPCTCQRR